MHANTGFRAEAFSQAKRFFRLDQDAESVLIPSSSCVAMIRDQYPALFQELGNTQLRDQFDALLHVDSLRLRVDSELIRR
jgi:L-lactate dehydrogenase complex protein LldE